jgi:hypothetical protein
MVKVMKIPENVSYIALQVVVGCRAFSVHHKEWAACVLQKYTLLLKSHDSSFKNIKNVTNVQIHTREHEMASHDPQIEAGQILSFLQGLHL